MIRAVNTQTVLELEYTDSVIVIWACTGKPRSCCPVYHMKRQFDKFLATLLDEPQVHGYTAESLLDMV